MARVRRPVGRVARRKEKQQRETNVLGRLLLLDCLYLYLLVANEYPLKKYMSDKRLSEVK